MRFVFILLDCGGGGWRVVGEGSYLPIPSSFGSSAAELTYPHARFQIQEIILILPGIIIHVVTSAIPITTSSTIIQRVEGVGRWYL